MSQTLKTIRQISADYGYPVNVIIDVIGDHGPQSSDPFEVLTVDSLVNENDPLIIDCLFEYIPSVL